MASHRGRGRAWSGLSIWSAFIVRSVPILSLITSGPAIPGPRFRRLPGLAHLFPPLFELRALLRMLAGVRNRVILGAKARFFGAPSGVDRDAAHLGTPWQPHAASEESRSCFDIGRERHGEEASGMPEIAQKTSITGKRRFSIPINTPEPSAVDTSHALPVRLGPVPAAPRRCRSTAPDRSRRE